MVLNFGCCDGWWFWRSILSMLWWILWMLWRWMSWRLDVITPFRFKLLSEKMWNFVFFLPEEWSQMPVVFFQGWSYRPSDSRMSGERSLEQKLKVLVPFLSYQEDWRATRPLPRPFYSKTGDSIFESAILFSIVERPNKYPLQLT